MSKSKSGQEKVDLTLNLTLNLTLDLTGDPLQFAESMERLSAFVGAARAFWNERHDETASAEQQPPTEPAGELIKPTPTIVAVTDVNLDIAPISSTNGHARASDAGLGRPSLRHSRPPGNTDSKFAHENGPPTPGGLFSTGAKKKSGARWESRSMSWSVAGLSIGRAMSSRHWPAGRRIQLTQWATNG